MAREFCLGPTEIYASEYPVGPAAVFLVPAGAIGAGLIEQPLADVLPDRMRPIEPDRVHLLDFDGAQAAYALDAQNVTRDFEEPALLDGQTGFPGRARIGEHSIP